MTQHIKTYRRNLLENKVTTYLGFAQKSGAIVYGIDNLRDYRKKMYLIIVCKTANDKYTQVANKIKSLNANCTILTTNGVTLASLLNKDNCKIIGIKNHSLAQAIIDNKLDILLGVN